MNAISNNNGNETRQDNWPVTCSIFIVAYENMQCAPSKMSAGPSPVIIFIYCSSPSCRRYVHKEASIEATTKENVLLNDTVFIKPDTDCIWNSLTSRREIETRIVSYNKNPLRLQYSTLETVLNLWTRTALWMINPDSHRGFCSTSTSLEFKCACSPVVSNAPSSIP